MKKKFKWLINISTLCLCICALAIGVYAAKQASLTVNGSIGFTAHGCDVDVTGYITGHADSADGAIVTTQVALTQTSIRGADASIALGTRYFSDLTDSGEVNDITISLTFTNKSLFNVEAKVGTPTVPNANILVAEDSTLVVMDKVGGTKVTQTITFTLSLKQNATDFSAGALSLKINFAKTDLTSSSAKTGVRLKAFDSTYASNVKSALGDAYCYDGDTIEYGTTYKNYAERFKYVELGKESATGDYLKWLVVGRDVNGVVTALTDEDKAIIDKGGLLNGVKYYLLSERALYTENSAWASYGLSYQNSYNTSTYKNPAGEKANDYATSNIRAYLNGEDVYRTYSYSSGTYTPSGATVNFYDTYSFSDAELARIDGRTLSELYTTDNKSFSWNTTSYTDLPNGQTLPSSVGGTETDKFWLLSESELMTVFAEDAANDGCYESIDTYMASRTLIQGVSPAQGADVANWWLRSPYADNDYYARYVGNEGYADDYGVDDSDYGVRAALRLA